MKTTNLKSSYVANDVARVAAVVLAGAMLYVAALGMEKTAVWQTMQSVSPIAKTAKLTNKKSCIVMAWQKQSGAAPRGMDSLRCAEYLPEQGNAYPMLAENR